MFSILSLRTQNSGFGQQSLDVRVRVFKEMGFAYIVGVVKGAVESLIEIDVHEPGFGVFFADQGFYGYINISRIAL